MLYIIMYLIKLILEECLSSLSLNLLMLFTLESESIGVQFIYVRVCIDKFAKIISIHWSQLESKDDLYPIYLNIDVD